MINQLDQFYEQQTNDSLNETHYGLIAMIYADENVLDGKQFMQHLVFCVKHMKIRSLAVDPTLEKIYLDYI